MGERIIPFGPNLAPRLFLFLRVLFPGETVAAFGRIINRHLSEQPRPEIQVS